MEPIFDKAMYVIGVTVCGVFMCVLFVLARIPLSYFEKDDEPGEPPPPPPPPPPAPVPYGGRLNGRYYTGTGR